GEAFLYDFSFTLKIAGKTVSNKQLAIGLRSVEVVNQADEMGESFLFKVNGEPVFMKGANYIPADSFVHRVTPQKHQAFFAATRDANMNMLRVWGGGIYQDDEFYRLADENGILIWQDFMFACTLYPAHQEFLDNVAAEAKYNICRLRNHACIAMWCGNNEVDMAISKWDWPQKFAYSDELYTRLKQDYITLFGKLLPEMVSEYDASRFYLRSSPIGFWENDEDNKGNHHYWGVWHGEEPFSEYQRRVPRFMSEFGFQSFPMPESMACFTQTSDHQLDSSVMQVHQKHPRGNSLIKSYMQDSFKAPKDFASLLYLSQVQQAEGLKLAFDAHRAAKPFCMGTLYWQLNDTWPAASWSGIDYYGRWKALHYQAKRSFASQSLIVQQLQEQIKLYWSNDTLLEFKHATVNLRLIDFHGKSLSEQCLPVNIAANGAELLFNVALETLLKGLDKSQVFMQVEGHDAAGNLVCANHHLFVADKLLALQPIDIKVAVLRQQGSIELTLTSDYYVRQLYVNLPNELGNFSDNFFDLLPGQAKVVTIKLNEDSLYHHVEPVGALQLLSVYDTYVPLH
uniref:beta-mannosidase n=1 Tax=Paraglaciecola sp. TaxID=1920173 RepID=UPI0030F4650D